MAGFSVFGDEWTGSAAHPATMSIPDMLRGLEAVVVAVMTAEGALKDANRGFLLLMSRTLPAPQPSDIRELFVNPRFDDATGGRSDPIEGTTYRGLLSVGGRNGKITALRGAVYAQGREFVLIAEHDVSGFDILRSTLLELQDDIEEKQRRIVDLEHRIGRLQELADAALHDRDALLDALARSGQRHGVRPPD